MKYYKIKRKTRFPELGRIASGAEGKNVPEKEYFDRIGKREIIENTPIFDYFVLFHRRGKSNTWLVYLR